MSPEGTIGHAEDGGSKGGLLDYNMKDEILRNWNKRSRDWGLFKQANLKLCIFNMKKKTGLVVFCHLG